MRVLIVNTDYPGFLRWLYREHAGLEQLSYAEQLNTRYESLFGVADFYSSNLRKLGIDAQDIFVNNEHLQAAWVREHQVGDSALGVPPNPKRSLIQGMRSLAAHTPLRYLKPVLKPFLVSGTSGQISSWQERVLAAQIQHYRPDVVLNQDLCWTDGQFWLEMKPQIRLLVGQIASPVPEDQDFRAYDSVLSSLPNIVERFQRRGMRSHLHRLAFEPRVLDALSRKGNVAQDVEVSFVGSLTGDHEARLRLLESLSRRTDLTIWGRGAESLPASSLLHRRWCGEVWGIEMYKVLRRSRITLNHHIDVAEGFANNMRLFEATGVGTFLLTDWKANLQDMFEPGKELVCYRSPEECSELIQYYLAHAEERDAIARAGQERTCREHTYANRMKELVDVVRRYL
jgi:spore maturation protein CgeB